ncbi:MAG: TIGR00296 family protein [Candidatus Micrarchaeaceae archaeon]
MKVYSLENGTRLVREARNAIELFISSPKFNTEIIEKRLAEFDQKFGVFVTLYEFQTKSLRGCIGFPHAFDTVKKLLPQAAIAAATEDPRFEQVSKRELEYIIVEVSMLSEPKKIEGSPEKFAKQIKIGEDGLIIEYGYQSGLLLPIVAVEEKWNARQFLENVCIKAGLPEHAWLSKGVSLYKFSTQVFREKSPGGDVEEVKL